MPEANHFISENEKQLDRYLQDNVGLAMHLGIRGTPAFIVINSENKKVKVVPGAANLATMEYAIKSVQ